MLVQIFKLLIFPALLSLLFLQSCDSESKNQKAKSPLSKEKESENQKAKPLLTKEKTFCKVGLKYGETVEWSNTFELTEEPHKYEFTNGHYVKMWLSENKLFHHWQRLRGHGVGSSSHFSPSIFKLPVAVAMHTSEVTPENSGTLYFHVIEY